MAETNNLSSAFKSVPACEGSTASTDVQHTGQISVSYNFNASKNRIPLIFRLPTETLESIFLHGARDHYYREEDSFLLRTTPRWVHVSYVCRRWRRVSLNCPILWTYLFETSPRWTEELLSRSKQVPLKLRVDLNFWDNTHSGLLFVEQVMTHVERLEEFRIRLPSSISPIHRIFSVLSVPAPCLRNLSFLPSYLSSLSEWPSSVPFGGHTPALRTLRLTRCELPWYSLKLNGLTTLDLSYIPSQSHQKSEDFLSTLRCMQDLTHLYLEHAVAPANDFLSTTAFNTVQKINLPHLSRLFIYAPLSTLVVFLSCVNFPSKTGVRLRCKSNYSSTLDDYLHLSSLITRRFQSFDCPVIRSLTIKFVLNKATLTFSTSELACDASVFAPRVDWFHNVPMQLLIHFDSPPMTRRDQDSIVSDMCCKMPLTNVRSVHVITPPFSSSFWSETLEHLLEIRYLKLSQGLMPDLAPLFSPTPHEDTEGGGLLAATLEELELFDITFSSSLDTKNNLPPAADVDSLYSALSTRKESGGKLTVSQCVVGQSYDTEQLDMVGRWGDGQFLVIEERRQPSDSVFESEDSDSEFPPRARRRNASF